MKSLKQVILETIQEPVTNQSQKDVQKIVVKTREELDELIGNLFSTKSRKKSQDLNHLDVSAITDMSYLFESMNLDEDDFDISEWNVSNVTNMEGMFADCKFNGDISKWNVSNVTNMEAMFSGFRYYGWEPEELDISKWNVSKVTNMKHMFGDSNFNGDISKWNVSNVTNMEAMFYNSSFNGDISKWRVKQVKKMDNMFAKSKFKQFNIFKWRMSSDTSTFRMFNDVSGVGRFGTNGEMLKSRAVVFDSDGNKI